ncbi:MAG: hypothetical protein JSR45_16420 [Proteobacteria bacterium]|nr:hypothetical protein [Pseudomonadota bacterium]
MRLPAVISAALACLLAPAAAFAAAPPAKPVEVMIVGDYHMGNPGKDLHNAKIDDVLAPERQAQLVKATDALARFKPTKVAAEWPADIAASRYGEYLAGTLKPSRNEVVQLGFRLAKTSGLKTVYGIDADGDFPFDKVDAWATAHGKHAVLDQAGAEVEGFIKTLESKTRDGTVSQALRFLNDPARIASDNGFYRTTLKLGSGTEQPGAELLTAWYRRNFLICANILQLAEPGDRIVVFYGSGHAFLLRQCVQETPGFKLVEPNAWLPK